MSQKTKAKTKRRELRAIRRSRGECCCGDELCDGSGPYPRFHRVGQEPNARHSRNPEPPETDDP